MDGQAGEENYELLSIDDRLTHKSWKARVSAYTGLVALFRATADESDPIFRNYTSNSESVKDWVKDSNAVSQEKGVEAACALLEWGGKSAARTRPDVVPALVEKCLGSARAGTRAKAIELCLLYVEVEEDMGLGVIEDVSVGLSAKQPKVVAGSVTVLKELVLLFGPKSISIKPILPLLSKIFAHSDKTVRAEGTLLCLALHAYLGPALTSHLKDLKPVQLKELTEAFVEADGKGEGFGAAKQTRFTRTQQRERAVKEAEGTLQAPEAETGEAAAEEAAEEQPLDVDPYEFAIPVAILSSLPADFYTHLASSKWKDRKELALDPLLALLRSSVKLESGNYDELVRALAGKMSDANVVCVTAAANCLESLALGLRSDFARYQAGVVALILERTKEKKTSVLDALGGALDAIFLSVSISDVIEDIALFSKHKNPSVKAETLKWLVRCLKITPTPPSKNDDTALMAALLPALEDSGEPVRVAAAEALGTLMKCVGERALQGQIDGLDGLRKEKVMEWFGKAVVKCKVGAPTRAAAAAPPAPVVSKPKPKPIASKPASPSEFDDAPPPVRPPPRAAPAPRPLAKKPLPPAAAPPAVKKVVVAAAPSKAPPPKAVEALRYKFTQEDAEMQADSIIPAPIRTGLSDSNWKERLAAMESMHSWLSGGEIENVESELVVRYLSKKPGWKESNFQVGAKMFGILHLLAESSPSFAKASAALSIPGLSDKLGDMKLKKPAGDALTIYAEKSSLQFVLSQAYEPMTKQKAPKAQADTLVWIEQSLRDFGVSGLSVRDLIEFLKAALKSTNAAVRTSATKAIVTLKLCVGSDISSFLQDVNPALLTTIQAEFDKIAGETAPAPTRFSADNASATTASGSGGTRSTKGGDADDALDQLFPRVDLEKLLSNATINACNDANWKTRKEALESIQSTLEANKRLKPSNLSDLTTALKLRLSDSNKVVQNLALDVVTRIATGMGKPFERQARILAGAVATVLADQKANIRASGVTALSAMADAAGLDTLISGFDKPLEAQNPVLRKELLAWLETRFEDKEVVATLDVTPIVGAVVNCLEDRNTDVRKSAAAILPVIVARAGYNYVIEQTASLKPASRATVLPLIEAARGSSTTSAPKAAAPVARTGGLKTLRRPEPSTAPTPPPDEPASRLGLPRPNTSLPSVKPKSSASSARSTPVPPPVASSSTLNQAPFKSADGQPKLIRQSKDIGSNKWIIDGTPRPEQVEFLYSQMAPHTNPDLLAQLFSKDHNAERDFGAALALLDDCVREPGFAVAQYDLAPEELAARMVANADLIFKYITLRIVLTNTTITVKCLDLIDHLIPVMASEGHRLSDYEVNALLLSLVTKLGDGKEVIRQRVRAILRSLCTLYPFSKVFNLILENGLSSKNARTRAESAEELGSLFQRYGVSSLPIVKALPVIARLIGDRDATVRSSALLAIGVVYSLVGADTVYKHIGTIPDKERSMLDERLKRTSSPTKPAGTTTTSSAPTGTPSRLPARTIPAPGGISRIGQGLKRPTNAPTLAPAAPILPPSSAPTALRQPNSRDPSPPVATRPTALARPNAVPTPRKLAPADVDPLGASHLIDSIVTDDFARSVEALKMVQVDIASDPTSLLPFADRLIDAISQQTQAAFNGLDSNTPTSTLRLCKHLMQTLSGFFDHKSLGEAVSSDALTVLLAELAGRLLDTADQPTTGAVGSLSKVLNMVMIRIFHHADQNACFTAIFAVLRDATIDLRELEGDELVERTEYADLVMKCLWKVSKSVKESLENQSLSPSRLLRVINDFLIAIPPAEWRRRATDGIALADMPLRTMKTILSAVVSVCDKDVTNQLYEIPEAETSYVYHYLVRMLNNSANGAPPATTRDSAIVQPATTRSAPTDSTTSGLPPTRTAVAAERPAKLSEGAIDIATNRELAAIFERIGDPGQSRAGIAELYAYRKEHPIADAKIQTWMSTTGTYFQTYLKRALDNLATTERERGASTPSSPHDKVAPPAVVNRPLSNTSSRRSSNTSSPARPISRSARLSTNGASDPTEATGATPGAAGRLQELQNLFGFKDATNGTME